MEGGTIILTLYKNYNYDSNYEFTKGFATLQDQQNYFNGLTKLEIDDVNYIRETEGSLKIYTEYPETYISLYDYLLTEGYNYIKINNGVKDLYYFITSKEWVSEDTCRINYIYDVLQSFMFDFTINKSYVKRKVCTIDEIADFDEGLDIGEPEIISEHIATTKNIEYYYVLNSLRITELLYDASATQVIGTATSEYSAETPEVKLDGVIYPLNFIPVSNPGGIGEPDITIRELLANHPSLVGIIGFPEDNVSSKTLVEANIPFLVRDSITGTYSVDSYNINFLQILSLASPVMTGLAINKSNFTDHYPYTYYVMTDGETKPLIMKPQHIDGSSILLGAKTVLSYNPVTRYYPTNYKGDSLGRVYNITNNVQFLLPSGKNEGANYLLNNSSAIETQRNLNWFNTVANVIQGAVPGALSGAVAGGGAGSLVGGIGAIPGAIGGAVVGSIGGVIGGINSIKSQNARLRDIELTPDSIVQFGNVSTRDKFSTNNVRIQTWKVKQKYLDKINDFVDRYGNQYNAYDTIDHKTYKGYVQMITPDIDSILDQQFIQIIINIFERGVYIE